MRCLHPSQLENLRLLFVMEHNRIVDALSEINPHFDDSLLYNEARSDPFAFSGLVLKRSFRHGRVILGPIILV